MNILYGGTILSQKNYSRYFIILQEDDRSFSVAQDKTQSGYVKIENKNDKCKITFYAQNLSREKNPYYKVLICGKKEKKQIINIGVLNIDDFGRCEISNEYDGENIGNLNISMKDIIGAAIVKSTEPSLISVMSGFLTSKEGDWKNYKVINMPSEERSENEFDSYEEKIQENIEKEVEKEEEKVREEVKDQENIEEEFKIEEDPVYLYFSKILKEFREESSVCPEIKRIKFYDIPVNSIEDMLNCEDYDKYTLVYYPVINYFSYIKEYGHYMIGLKFNKEGRLKYLAYAIPGENDKRSQPFGGRSGFVTYVSEDGQDESKGFWMMFYDFKNKAIVIPVK